MGEERNSRVPLYCSNECVIAHTIKNSICQSLEKDALCSNSKSLKILEEFRQIYEERLRKIDEDTGGEGIELKLKTLTSWVNDLGEQNVMLVQTVEQLEQEAADRVALLEERLKKSSHIALEYMSKLEEYDNKMLDVTEDRVQPMLLQIKTSTKLAQAQQTEEILKNRIGNLQNDISGLLELIRRARCDGSWDTDGLSFLEVTYEDIFGSLSQQGSDKARTVDHLQSTITTLHQKLGESLEDYHRKETEVKVLQEQVAAQKADMMLKDLQLKHFAEKIQGFCVPGESKQVMHPEKSAFCDVAVMTDFSPGEDKPVTILWNRRSCQSESEVLEMSVNPCVNIDNLQKTLEPQQETLKMLQEKCNSNKRSVSFAPPCNEDYEHQIQELEEALKEAQNAREFRERRAVETGGCSANDELQIIRRIEECRVNTVLAQAATEEVMEEIDNLVDNLKTREEKIHEMEYLQNTLMLSFQDISSLVRSVLNKGEKIDDIGGVSPLCQTRVQAILQLLGALKLDTHEIVEPETQMARPEHSNISPKFALGEITTLLDHLAQQEKEMIKKYLELHHLEEKLNRLHMEMKDTQKKTEEYVTNKEISYHSQMQSEQKIKKLQHELESVQEDLELCLKSFEPTDPASLDLE